MTERLSIDADNLTGWLTEQRWFGSKARELSGVNLLDVLNLDDREPHVVLALCEARFLAGTHELYQLLLSAQPEGDQPAGSDTILASAGWALQDAMGDVGLVQRLASLVGQERVVESERACVKGRWVTEPLGSPPEVRLLGAEQSNTSVVLDGRHVLKVFRRLEPGDNPELEMLRFLSARDFPHVPSLSGWLELHGDVMDATLAIVQGFVEGGRDGWELALDLLERREAAELVEHLAALGTVTGRMHAALGADATDPAFAPEEPSAESLSLVVATIDEQIEQVFIDLPDLPELAPIAGRGPEVRELLGLLGHASVGGRLIRHHGDFHLGQCLLAPEGWVVLDFEGEPARTIRERRRKRSPLRDVAGMLRSFAYAASAVELQRGVPAPPGFEAQAREAFLEAWTEAVDPALVPAGDAAMRKQLSIYELEKVVYELRYELNNRPEWLPIPVAGILRLLDAEGSP